ncbi:MAG: tRNA (adenosine(37)-N6)-threonylcarbamoyltransferase complex ATPase subunit type 1 TsaE [SAR202 cluster bacterium Io17-Chloro-G7]|nr:MAG: tRNA (adenosine(37)-N6)-threonylcarbamoyltransferase complex ATPase subunit type 1 TsaE [SAR202 cluster bacterium Io17-Chloro-G7]
MAQTLRFDTGSPEDTQAVGELIGRLAQSGDIFLLTGPLGAGKTCLSQGIARGLEIPQNLRSPTFVLMTRHQGRLVLHHVDLYRINDPWEAWDLGLDEQMMGDGVCVVEWADKATEIFPADSCWISLDYGPHESCRTLTIATTPLPDTSLLDEPSSVVNEAVPRYESLIRHLKAAFPTQVDDETGVEKMSEDWPAIDAATSDWETGDGETNGEGVN